MEAFEMGKRKRKDAESLLKDDRRANQMGLFIDIGSNCGMALMGKGEVIFAKQFDLYDGNAKATQGERFLNFQLAFTQQADKYSKYISYVGYEDSFHQQGMAQQYFLGSLGVLKMMCASRAFDLYKVPTKTAKKFGVGSQTKDKEVITNAINTKFDLDLDPSTESDAADAVTVGCGFYGLLETNPFGLKLNR